MRSPKLETRFRRSIPTVRGRICVHSGLGDLENQSRWCGAESTLEEWKEPKAHNELQNRASR